jgi:hypothetical protein
LLLLLLRHIQQLTMGLMEAGRQPTKHGLFQ